MTASAVQARPAPAPVRVPAAASIAVRPQLASGDARGEVLGVSSHAVWIRTGDDVVVVSTRDATRLPNAVEIAALAAADPFGSIEHRERVTVGSTSIAFAALTVEVARWWDPRPILAPTNRRELSARVRGLPSSVPDVETRRLRHALSTSSPSELCSVATGLLGRGPGLTPEGDDYLAGALAATRTLGSTLGAERALAMLDDADPQVTAVARTRTTAFSAALIRCALRGEVAAPAAALLRALAGRGDVLEAHRRLLSVGHSSGPALAAGIVLGTESLTQLHDTPNGGLQ